MSSRREVCDSAVPAISPVIRRENIETDEFPVDRDGTLLSENKREHPDEPLERHCIAHWRSHGSSDNRPSKTASQLRVNRSKRTKSSRGNPIDR